MDDIETLKSKLSSIDYFVDNEWLVKYVELVVSNANTQRVSKVTQRHHVVPASYFRSRKEPVDNSDSNLVNLSYKNHMLAHLYLSGCTRGRDRYKNLYSVFQMSHFDRDGYLDIQNYDYYQQLYESAIHAAPNHRKGAKVTEETRQRMSRAQKLSCMLHGSPSAGTAWMTNGIDEKMVNLDEVEDKLNDGYHLGRLYRHSQATRDRISECGRNRIVTDEFREKMRKIGIQSNIGRSPESYKRQGRTLSAYYQTHTNPFKGKKHSEESLQRNRQSHLGRKGVHKDGVVKMVRPEELEAYIADGWQLGRPPKHKKI